MSMSAADRARLPGSAFAVPELRALPMHDRTHVRLAWSSVSRTDGLTEAQRERARERILKQASRLGVDTHSWVREDTVPGLDDPALPEPMSLEEIASRAERARQYIRDNKGRFKQQFGKAWHQHILDRVRSMFGVEAQRHPHGEEVDGIKRKRAPLAEITVTVSGPVGSGKTALLSVIDAGLKTIGVEAQFDDEGEGREVRGSMGDPVESARHAVPGIVSGPVILRVAYERPESVSETTLVEDVCTKAQWKNRRSLTSKEVESLNKGDSERTKAAKGCGKAYVEGKGFCVYTHRARSKFYERPDLIPTSALKFIQSTG